MKPFSHKQRIVDVVGSLGYIAVLIQWLWLAALSLPFILQLDVTRQLTSTSLPSEPVSPDFGIVGTGVAIIIVIASIALGMYALYKVPGVITKSGNALTHKSADLSMPILMHKKKINKKRQFILNYRLIIISKILASFLPFVISLLIYPLPSGLTKEIVMVCGVFLLSWTFLWFALQIGLTKIFGLPKKSLY